MKTWGSRKVFDEWLADGFQQNVLGGSLISKLHPTDRAKALRTFEATVSRAAKAIEDRNEAVGVPDGQEGPPPG